MAYPNAAIVGDVLATTIAKYSKTIADNVTNTNIVLGMLNKKGNVSDYDGGFEIREGLTYQANSNAGSYSASDLLPTAATDGITNAQYQLCQYAVPVVITGREMLQNSGDAAIYNLVKQRVLLAEKSAQNLFNQHVYLDGTGNSGKNITGLAAAVPLASTNVYGGIDRSVSTNAFWKNQKFQATVDGSGVATSATIQAQWTALFNNCIRGTDRVNLIIASPASFNIFEGSLQAIQRITSSEDANAGFVGLSFMGVPVFYEPLAAGITTNITYFLNTDYLHLRNSTDRNWVALEDKSSVNQDMVVKTLVWAGNLTCSGAKFQGIHSNT